MKKVVLLTMFLGIGWGGLCPTATDYRQSVGARPGNGEAR